jgi:Ca2+-binding EF-hand superfamily protein
MGNYSLADWMMDFLLMLTAYGITLTPGSSVSEFDFNGNGYIDVNDIMEMLSIRHELINELSGEGMATYSEK